MLDVDTLAGTLGLDRLLGRLGRYELVDHWSQGEFHHDVVVRTDDGVLVVATNCNGGIKEVVAFDDVPDRWALWAERCPDNVEFSARRTRPLPAMRGRARTCHWFNPCELLVDDARSELKPASPSRRRRRLGTRLNANTADD